MASSGRQEFEDETPTAELPNPCVDEDFVRPVYELSGLVYNWSMADGGKGVKSDQHSYSFYIHDVANQYTMKCFWSGTAETLSGDFQFSTYAWLQHCAAMAGDGSYDGQVNNESRDAHAYWLHMPLTDDQAEALRSGPAKTKRKLTIRQLWACSGDYP